MIYIRKYKIGDIQLKSSRKNIIITNLIIGIVVIVLLIAYITEPVRFFGVIGLGLLIISLICNTEIWSVKTENNILFVKTGLTRYIIPFKDLIDIKLIKRRNFNSNEYTEILQIKYRKNNKIRYIELTYVRALGPLFYIKLVNEDKIIAFTDKFSTNRFSEEKDGYLNIRTQEEEKELEELLSNLLWNKDLQDIEPKKVTIIIISTIIITIGIILCFLIPYIIECSS